MPELALDEVRQCAQLTNLLHNAMTAAVVRSYK